MEFVLLRFYNLCVLCALCEKFFLPASLPQLSIVNCQFLIELKLTVLIMSPKTPAAVTPAPAP